MHEYLQDYRIRSNPTVYNTRYQSELNFDTTFVTLTSGGIKQEGAQTPVLCSSREKAEELYRAELDKYCFGCTNGLLHWRRFPTVAKIITYSDNFDVDYGPYASDWWTIVSRVYLERN